MKNTKSKHNLKDTLNSIGQNKSYGNVSSRSGKRMVATYVTVDMHKKIKIYAAKHDMSLQDILYNAIDCYISPVSTKNES